LSPETRKIVAVAAGAAALPSVIAIALVLRSESRLSELERTLAARPSGEPSPLAPAPRAAPTARSSASAVPGEPGSGQSDVRLDERGIPVDRIVAYDSFERLWRGALAREAETSCWRSLEASGHARLQPITHFLVTVSAKGDVTDVVPDSVDTDESSRKLHECVAKIVKKMRFPEPGKAHSGRVQADRPR